ncbi:rRNA pseudouridine synthase [Caproiciproducens galactitolivorans]|uniref:Pseudouridine synthase n=1 Tax=Caproiciproducens galactitolivorans TaxID=642589 RepID=A0A4Z0YCY2_9FIRM|nr:pseudouridine synthase [Caproiciproducens galactitolivorans]QEY35384.1 rRNA pseudouridine synthase [Caproiciproducens galactitolivorans]TGJ75706.1 ribosomal small subunit pseudouridine synthase A [Caproiciproducens galactitolivorans]
MSRERLDKILALHVTDSRKDAGAMIRRGEIAVNGKVVKKADFKVDTLLDEVTINGEPLSIKEFVYLMMNKPSGVLSAARDARAQTVVDLLPPVLKRRGLFPAGRLDRDTEGLLIITDDGAYAHRMLMPKSNVYKHYEAVLARPVTADDVAAFENGVVLKDRVCLPAKLEVLEEGEHPLVRVRIHEGKFHQVKRMFLARNNEVLKLKRVKIGALVLDNTLKPGEAREMSVEEANSVFL